MLGVLCLLGVLGLLGALAVLGVQDVRGMLGIPRAMDTETGSGAQPGPAGAEVAEAAGYAHEVHADSWAASTSDRRQRLITDFTNRTKATGVRVATVKAGAMGLRIETEGFRMWSGF